MAGVVRRGAALSPDELLQRRNNTEKEIFVFTASVHAASTDKLLLGGSGSVLTAA